MSVLPMIADVGRVLYLFVPAYAANMAPVLARGHLVALARPLDFGCTVRGVRLLGDHKTWRGIVAGTAAGVLVYAIQAGLHRAGALRGLALVDYDAWHGLPGLLMGVGAGLGDAAKSLVKRRIGIAPGESWVGFDQLDFMAGSYLTLAPLYLAPLAPTILALPVIFVGSILVTATAYTLHMKEAWI